MEKQKNGSYNFQLRGKIYNLIFEGDSPVVFLNGVKQISRRILRDYILKENLPIEINHIKKDGSVIEKTTNQYGVSLQKYLGINSTIITKIKSEKLISIDQVYKKVLGKIIIENGSLNINNFFNHEINVDKSFNINWLNSFNEFFDEKIQNIFIESKLFEVKGDYNKFLRNNVKDNKLGCYLFSNPNNEEVLYVGMAGKLKTDGSYSKHCILNRLQAPRIKDLISKKDISTEYYLKNLFTALSINNLRITILYTKSNIPSGYLEALLLFDFYKKYGVLPLLNNAF